MTAHSDHSPTAGTHGTTIEGANTEPAHAAVGDDHVPDDRAADDLPPGFRYLYAGCVRRPHPDRPWVLANMVMGLDGSATLNGRAGDLSDPTDQRLFSFLRTQADAILVGAQTVRVEQYGAVGSTTGPPPRMVVLTASGRLDFDTPLFTESARQPLVVTTSSMRDGVAAAAGSRAEVVAAGDRVVDMARLLESLRRSGVERVLTEGGPTVLSEIMRSGSLDELCITIAPVIGGGQRRVFENAPAGRSLTLAHSVTHGDRLFCRYLAH